MAMAWEDKIREQLVKPIKRIQGLPKENLKSAIGYLMDQRGLSNADMAEMLGMDKTSFERKTAGKAAWKAPEITMLVLLLGTKPDQLESLASNPRITSYERKNIGGRKKNPEVQQRRTLVKQMMDAGYERPQILEYCRQYGFSQAAVQKDIYLIKNGLN
jgi:hypothetical protein